jgi:hypothetical protein
MPICDRVDLAPGDLGESGPAFGQRVSKLFVFDVRERVVADRVGADVR